MSFSEAFQTEKKHVFSMPGNECCGSALAIGSEISF